jgi:hypothetical protein
MKPPRLLLSVVLMGVAAGLLSCGEAGPTAPELQIPVPQARAVSAPRGLLRCRPLASASVTRTIGPNGGSIRVRKHVLVIPALALSRPVKIKAVVPSDTVNRIELQPEGLVFRSTVSLTMSYANCNIGQSARRTKIAYTNDSLAILKYMPSDDDPSTNKVTGRLKHFSEYAVSW